MNKLVFLRTQQTLYSAKAAGQRHRTDTEPMTVNPLYNQAKEIRAGRDIQCFVLLNKSSFVELSLTSYFLSVCLLGVSVTSIL